jgi:transposase InsO family protein
MKRASIYLKLQVIGAVDSEEGPSVASRIRKVAKRIFHDEEGQPRVYTWRTIQTWVSLYRQGGVDMLKNRPRSDRGFTRKVDVERLSGAIEKVLPEFRDGRYNKMEIYRRCIMRGLISKQECSQTSFFRLVHDYDLLTPSGETENRRRLAFSKQYANEMWQLDTMFGPYVKNGRTKTQAKLIAFIDDASRIIPHGEFFFSENTPALICAMRSAFYKRGVPQTLYVDNGSIYTSAEINQICARVGTLLCHTPVRDGASKGKIERFFRTVRDRFLLQELDLTSLETLNRQFNEWVESEYNAAVHGTLKMKPVDRFAMDAGRIRFLDPLESNEELFFFEEERAVRKDNTFQVAGRRYEAPRNLANTKISVRYDRTRPGRIIVFFKNQRMGEANLLDPVANDRPPKPADRKEQQ